MASQTRHEGGSAKPQRARRARRARVNPRTYDEARRPGTKSVHGGALRAADEALDLLVGEAGETARLLGDRDGDFLVVAVQADAPEVEALVDRLLELDRATPTLGIALGQLVEPLRPHAHVRDLVGEHEVHGPLDDRVADLAGDVHELVEDVTGQPLEPAVHARDPRRRVLGAGASPEDRRLGKLAHVTTEGIYQAQRDLHVARLVPDLPGHIQGELPRRVREVADRSPRPLHGLKLADEDAVHTLADRLPAREVGHRRQALLDPHLADLPRPLAHEAVLARQLVVGDRPLHGRIIRAPGTPCPAAPPAGAAARR